MSYAIELPDELAKEFMAEIPEQEREKALAELVSEFLDKRKRQKKREALLKNASPIIKKYSGIVSEEDMRSLNDERVNYLLNT